MPHPTDPLDPGFFRLGGIQDNFIVSVIDAQGDGDILNSNLPINSTDNFPPTNGNSWLDLPIPLNTSLDALRIIEIGSARFNQLSLGTFLVNDTEIQINALPKPTFDNGAYVVSGGDDVDRIFIPNNNLVDNVTAEVLGHEIGHLYLNANHGQLRTVISRESSGIYEFLADMIGFEIDLAVQGMNGTVDWQFLDRDYSSEPILNYSDPGFGSLGSHAMATVGGHWAWQMNQSTCFDFEDLFTFLLFCTTENNAPEVVNYPTLRDATLEHYSAQLNYDCGDCIEEMVNAWYDVGVGSPYSPQTPTILPGTFNVGPCSVAIEWEDQGVQQFIVQVFEIDAPGGAIVGQIGNDFCVRNQNQFNLCTSDFSGGDYRIVITPACGPNCIPMDNIIPFHNDFVIPGNSISTIFTANATSCDLVITTQDIGLHLNNYSFEYYGSPFDPLTTDITMYRQNGQIIFYFEEPFTTNQNGFENGDMISIMVTDGCMPEMSVGPINITINSSIDDLLFFELHEDIDPEFTISKCYVQPVLNTAVSFELTRFHSVRSRLKEIDVVEYNALSQPNADRTYESNVMLMEGADEVGQIGPNIPLLEIPTGSPKYFAMNLEIIRNLYNEQHPFSNDQYCSARYNTDIVVFEIQNPPQNCTTVPTITQIDYCVEGTNVIIDFLMNEQMENISHIEYRYRFENEVDFGPCHQTISQSVTFEDDRLISNEPNCLGGIVVEARVICDCNDPICSMIWPVGAQNSQTITSNLCPPASPIDPTLDPDNPDYTGIATFGNQITLDYYSAPGVHSYRAWYRPIDLIDVDPNQRIECNIPVDPCLPLASYTFDVNIPQGAVTNFCQIGRTIRFPVPDGQQPYRVYLESLCCPANSVATCDNQMNLSDCYLVADSAPACTMDDQQIITTTVLSSTQIEIGWLDQIIADTEYIIRAEPINCNNNEPAFMEVFIGNPNPNNIHEFTLNELLPNTNYNITVSKNCSGVLCSGCTIDISVQESTQDLGQLTITEVCNNMLAEIRIPLETINNTPPPYNFILAGEPSLPTWWDAQTNEYVIGGVRAGSFTLEIEECSFLFWPVTINEDLDCLIANIGACGTMVNEEIDLDSENLITNIVNSNDYNIPHQWQGDKLILENLKLHFYGQSNLVLDSNVEFRNCEIYMESGNQMEVQLLLFLTENTIIDKCNGGNWEGLIMHSGSSLFMTNSSMLGAKTAISYNTSIEEISIFGKSNFVTSTIEAANGIISSGPSDAIANIINVTGSSLNLSDNSGIQLRALDVYISSSQIIGARRAISIRNALNVDIVNGCIINSIATAVSIITSSGNVNLSNNSSILSEENTAISINTSNVTIASNDQIQSGGGQPAISGLDWTSCDISTNFNITGSVEIDGVANETNLFFNKIISPTNGIDLQEADNAILRCNDITSINNSINLSSNCMYTDLFGNVLNFGSENDLFSEQSTFIQVPDDNGNIMHRGNCFRGEYVKSSFSDPVFLAESIFYVDTVEQDCFEPKYGSLELFSIDLNPESTQQCPALFINSFMYYNETEICTSLRNIEKLLNDTNLSQVGILRLLNLLKQIRENEMVMPSCIRSFLDTTSYCSFNMYEKFHDIQTDRNDLLLDYQIQSTITQLYLKLWQSYDSLVSGNSTEQKNLLYEKYLVAKSVLLDLAQQIQRENQDIHNYVNNSTFSTCLDSLSVMKRNVLSLKYKQSTFSNSEKNYILSQARLCSRRYGYVIHEFRAIARQFSEEDFSGYDDCVITRGGTRDRSTNINESIRTKIIPNPAATEFQVISSSFEITKINIYSLEGNIVYQSLANGMKHNINSSKLSPGIYFIKIIYDNQSSDLQKLIIH